MNFADKQKRRILYSHVRIGEEGCELLDYMTNHFSRFDRAGWQEQIRQKNVVVNDLPCPPEHILKRHDRVSFFPGELPEPGAALHYKTVYADKDILVFDKPADLCVHPTGPFYRHTLWNLAGQDYGEVHFVSRLDRETSGLILAARNKASAAKLEAMRSQIRKEYQALVIGRFTGAYRAKGFLIPDPESSIAKKKKFIPEGDGESCDTELYEIRQIPPDMTLVRAVLHTGRRHQIRATLYSLGYPLAGDKLYGPDETLYNKIRTQSFTEADKRLLRYDRQCLHASFLAFPHPQTGEELYFESPPDFC